jgi:plasmid stabilization system protein ParE
VPQLIWSPEALTDVQRLYRFLAEKNLMLADVQQA